MTIPLVLLMQRQLQCTLLRNSAPRTHPFLEPRQHDWKTARNYRQIPSCLVVPERQQKILTLDNQKWAKLLVKKNVISDSSVPSILYNQVWLHKHFLSQQSQFNVTIPALLFTHFHIVSNVYLQGHVIDQIQIFDFFFFLFGFHVKSLQYSFVQFTVASA